MGEVIHPSKEKLLDAALQVIRVKGYTATRIEDICEAAGLTKGSFFHHFKSKEDLAIAAAEHWSAVTAALFQAAPFHRHADALDRVLGYIDYRKELIRGPIPEFTCLVGTMVQEAYDTEPAIRDACDLGYLVTEVTDSCLTYSQERHDNSLRAIKGYCRQRTTDQVISELA